MFDTGDAERIEQTVRLYAQIVESSDDAILSTTLDGIITGWNAGAERIYGYTAEEAIGRSITMLVPPERDGEIDQILGQIRRGERIDHFDTIRMRKDGARVDVSVTISPILDAEGSIVGASTVARDITERKRAEEALLFQTSLLDAQSEASSDGILFVSSAGEVISANRRFAEIWRIPDDILASRSIREFRGIAVNAVEHPEAFMARISEIYKRPDEETHDLVRLRDGRILERISRPVTGAGDTRYGRVWLLRDITERQRLDEELRRSQARLADSQRIAHLGSWDWNIQTNEVQWSDEGYRIAGYEPGEIDLNFDAFMSHVDHDDQERLRQAIAATLDEHAPFSIDFSFTRRDGEHRVLHSQAEPVVSQDGRPNRMIGTLLDMTELKQIERALQRQATLIQLLQEVAVAANEAATVDEALRTTLEAVCRRTGWPGAHALRLAGDGDRALVSTGIWHLMDDSRFQRFRDVTEAMTFTPGHGLPGRVLQDGKPVWLKSSRMWSNLPRAQAAREVGINSGFAFPVLLNKEAVAVLEFFSTEEYEMDEQLLDVMEQIGTQIGRVIERQRSEAELRRRERQFKTLAENAPDIIVRFDRQLRLTYGNPALGRVIGRPIESAIGQSIGEVSPSPERAAVWTRNLTQVIDTGESVHFEIEYDTPGGKHWYHAHLVPEFESGETVDSVLAISRDITERKRLEAQLTLHAYHDSLTGLPNRLYFMDRLESALARFRRQQTQLAALYLDLDGFKAINDSIGHAGGDALLSAIGRRLRACVRVNDTVARLGGDEFTILLEDIESQDEAIAIAGRIIEDVTQPYEVEGRPVTISVCVGIAYPEPNTTAVDLLRHADTALYEAKRRDKGAYAVFDAALCGAREASRTQTTSEC